MLCLLEWNLLLLNFFWLCLHFYLHFWLRPLLDFFYLLLSDWLHLSTLGLWFFIPLNFFDVERLLLSALVPRSIQGIVAKHIIRIYIFIF